MTPASQPRHLRLVRPSSPGPTPDPDDPDVAELIDEATAWKRVVVEPGPDMAPAVQLSLARDVDRHGTSSTP